MALRLLTLTLALAFSALPTVCRSMPVGLEGPLFVRNQNPLVQATGLPSTEGPDLVPDNELRARLTLDIANNFASSGDRNSGYVYLDGESWRITAVLRYGLSDTVELGLDIPYSWHSPGAFDDFIVNWHDFFSLPPGGRTHENSYEVMYRYAQGKDSLLLVDSAEEGISDIQISCGVRLYGSEDSPRALTCRTAVKLPTGDAKRLTGSGGTDLSVRFCGRDESLLAGANIVLNGTIGVLCLGNGDILPGLRSDLVGFGSIGLCGRFWQRVVPKVQMDWHTEVYQGAGLRQAGGYWANQLTFGLSAALSENTRLDIAISEDLVVSSSPDVALHLALVKTL